MRSYGDSSQSQINILSKQMKVKQEEIIAYFAEESTIHTIAF